MLGLYFLAAVAKCASTKDIKEWALNEVICTTDFYLRKDWLLECLGNEMAHSILKHGT
jgi:hypothetical protein